VSGGESEAAGAGPARSVVAELLAALAIGVLQMGVAVSLAALVFSGTLAPGVGRASVAFVLGTAVVSFVVGLRTRMPVVIAGAQDTAAIVAAAAATSMAAVVAPDQQLATVIVMLAVAAVVTGIAMYLVGARGYGLMVRYLPYPVISGFMAGTGWLLFRGGIEVMLGRSVHLADLGDLFEWNSIKFLLVGLALALFMVVCTMRQITPLAISGAILVSAVGFHLVGRSVSSAGTLNEQGWLIGPFPESGGWSPVRPSDLAAADWGAIGAHIPAIVAISAVSLIGLMLNLSGAEVVLGTEVDIDRELESAGGANLVVGAAGGLIGYHLIGDTSLAHQLGAKGRAIPIGIAGLALAVAVFGYELIALMPRATAGGVLAGLGLNLLLAWGREMRRAFDRPDRLISALILFCMAAVGVLTGIALGVMLAALIFVVRYARISPVRYTMDGAGRSNVDRPPAERGLLGQMPGRIVAVELQGFLFFGSVLKLRRSITDALAVAEPAPVEDATGAAIETDESVSGRDQRYAVLDFARVPGLDSTAATGLAAMANQLSEEGVQVVWSGLSAEARDELERNGVPVAIDLPDRDRSIAWSEEQLLSQIGTDLGDVHTSFSWPHGLQSLLESRTLLPAEALISPTSQDRDLYFVESGHLTVWTEADTDQRRRIRQVSAESVLGEIGFVTGMPRTASVIADTVVTVNVLRREVFDELRDSDPDLALAVQEQLLERLALRLSTTTGTVRDLMR